VASVRQHAPALALAFGYGLNDPKVER